MDETELVRAFLADRDVPCPMCKYNLRDLTSARCPECGETIQLRVALAEPKQAAWIAGLIGLSAGMGFVAILSLLTGVALLLDQGPGTLLDAWPLWLAVLVEALALWAWLRYATWIRVRSAFDRRLAAIGCWALTAVMLVLVIVALLW